MDKSQDLLEWIKKIPDWIKGAIGLLTLILGFIALFNDNPYLGVTVSIASILIAILCLGVYVLLSKKDSVIIGGGRVYRFPHYRRLSVIGIVFVLTSFFLVPFVEPVRTFTTVAFVGTAIPTPTITPTPHTIWKLKVYFFQNFGELAEKEQIGEVLSGLILDELLKKQLNLQQGTLPPSSSAFIFQGMSLIGYRGIVPDDVIEEYEKNAPFIAITGYIQPVENNKVIAHIRVSGVCSIDLRTINMFADQFDIPHESTEMQVKAIEIAEHIFDSIATLGPYLACSP